MLINLVQLNYKKELISCSDDKTIKLWNLTSGVCLITLQGHENPICCLKYLSNNKLVSGRNNGVIKVWDLKYFECTKTFSDHKNSVNCFQLIPFNGTS